MTSLEDPLAVPTSTPPPTPAPEHWTERAASLHDFASVLAAADETDHVEPYMALVQEFADCMGSTLDDEDEELYKGLSPPEMVAMTIWASGLYAAFSWFSLTNFEVSEGGEEDSTEETEEISAYEYMEAALALCQDETE